MDRSDANKAILTGLLSLCALVACGSRAHAADPAQPQGSEPAASAIRVTIYPILVKAPIFGASVDLPSVPSAPGGGAGGGDDGSATSGSTDASLNAAYMGGALIEANRWFVEAFGVWAALSATHSTPRVSVDSDAYFYSARAGLRLVGGLSATGGFRFVRVDFDATLSTPIQQTTLEGRVKPRLWDPLVGIDWRRSSGPWSVDGNLQAGGFGVGTDVDVSADVHARWRVVRHLELRAGYSLIYFKLTVADVNIGRFQRTLIAKQSLHGPELGVGLVF